MNLDFHCCSSTCTVLVMVRNLHMLLPKSISVWSSVQRMDGTGPSRETEVAVVDVNCSSRCITA